MALKTEELDVHDRVNGKVQHTRAGAFVVHDCSCDKCPLCIESTQRELTALAAARLACQTENEQLKARLDWYERDLPFSVEDGLQRVRTLVQSEAGQIAYLNDHLDELIAVTRKEERAAAEGIITILKGEADQLASDVAAACTREGELRRDLAAAEAARTALRQDLEALIRAWLADADALPGSELFDAAENRLRACARDLADRLARAEKK